MKMRNELLAIVGAQDIDTSGYQVSDLDDVEFHWDNDQLDVDDFFRPGTDTPFCTSTFKNFEMGSMAENPNLIDDKHGNENSPPLPHLTTPVSERPTQTPLSLRCRPSGTRIEKNPDYVDRSLFE